MSAVIASYYVGLIVASVAVLATVVGVVIALLVAVVAMGGAS